VPHSGNGMHRWCKMSRCFTSGSSGQYQISVNTCGELAEMGTSWGGKSRENLMYKLVQRYGNKFQPWNIPAIGSRVISIAHHLWSKSLTANGGVKISEA